MKRSQLSPNALGRAVRELQGLRDSPVCTADERRALSTAIEALSGVDTLPGLDVKCRFDPLDILRFSTLDSERVEVTLPETVSVELGKDTVRELRNWLTDWLDTYADGAL